MNDSKVKILISYHKPSILLKDDVLTPIHVGRALATEASKDGSMSEEDYKWMLDNMIGDDTGDNISDQNRIFNEITSVYWAWKNYDKLGNPDYIGFMHYRRHLNFNIEKNYEEDQWCMINNDTVDNNYIENYYLNANKIEDTVKNYDILTIKKWNVAVLNSKNNYDHYKSSNEYLKIKDYDIVLNILKNKYPEYIEDINNYNNSQYGHYYNTFVLKKEIFFDYCNWIFNILFEAEKEIDKSYYSMSEIRTYYSEWLYGIYIFHLKRVTNYKIVELQGVTANNLSPKINIKPKFKDSTKVCFCCDNNYAPYMAVTIKSLIDSSNKNSFYEIYILEDNIKSDIKNKIYNFASENCYIRFIDINAYLDIKLKNLLFVDRHLNIATYFRFFIPTIFKNFSKILYLDTDITIHEDIYNLYNTDLKNYALGACRDTEMFRRVFYEERRDMPDGYWRSYFRDILPLKEPRYYFQAGVLLFDIKKCIDMDLESLFKEALNKVAEPKNHDQDLLNLIFQKNIMYIDISWNVMWSIPFVFNNMTMLWPVDYYLEYLKTYNNYKILHYCGEIKPWTHPSYPKSYIWWEYARKTPFYEEIIYKNTNVQNIQNIMESRFSIGDFILSFVNKDDTFIITFLGINIKIKKKELNQNNYEKFTDRIFSIYKNYRYTRITLLGFKIIKKRK
ncbi:DUF4422 domain-containing protein [uncultured Brachyspira sp.]|uniref:DUF4422 domain-containing protein n=1 Tax=uncultured Brachyspira sp. TaxID=221953 RepID=UPI002606A611|nr:DUF4422 domain-containing protein [uncultured Brachyspira sp.]